MMAANRRNNRMKEITMAKKSPVANVEEVQNATAAPVKAAVKKAAVKKAAPAPAKKAPAPAKKAAVKKAAEPAGDAPVRKTDTSIKRSERQDIVIKALRKLKAFGPDSAKSKADVAKTSGLSEFDAYGVMWSQSKLQLEGYVAQCVVEGVRGVCFYLTKLGQTKLPSEATAE